VSDLSVVHHHRAGASALLPRRQNDQSPLVATDAKGRRSKIWDIAPSLHCSIIGTCLSAAELRQFFARLGDADARTASDNVLHGRGVRSAGKHDLVGKLLNKMLDNRHEATIRRFAKASSAAQARELWLEAFEQGNIPGGYWAVLTHPATDRPLVEEAFGQVHMLSHMVGSSNRIDIARLRTLERELGERDEKISRQQARLSESARERAELLRRVEGLEMEVRRREATERTAAELISGAVTAATLLQRLDTQMAHSSTLAARVAELESEVEKARKFATALNKQNDQLQREVMALESELRVDDADGPAAKVERDLLGVTVLYVGGRPGLIDQLKAAVARRGGALLSHDGGIEENLAALPGLISRADATFFPMDCISHSAVGHIKKYCRDGHKPFTPLRTARIREPLRQFHRR
jgi:predicted nucleic acid-binding protein